MSELRAAITAAAQRLAGSSDTPSLDAELLISQALGIEREALLLGRAAGRSVPAAFFDLLDRRAGGEPIAYILGHRDFWTVRLTVAPGVLIPRADSETLIEAAVDHFAGSVGPRTILDLGTGSGALLLAALDQWPEATGVGIDASDAALAIARVNAAQLGMAARATMRRGGWEGTGEAVDLLLCNPPYIGSDEALPRSVVAFEPASALFAGADGLNDYRRIAPLVRRQLAPGGVACFEIGATQAQSVSALLAAEGLSSRVRQDLAGRDRCLVVSA